MFYAIIQQKQMRLYTKTDKQMDNCYEVFSIKESLSKQKFFLILVLLFSNFLVIMTIRRIIQPTHNLITFSFR